jgi:hypothetical protein
MDRVPPVARREPMIWRHDEVRREPFEVHSNGPQRLVEVVDVEDLGSLGRGIQAEVGQVRIAAQLDEDPAARPRGQVGRHRQGGAAIERERRHRHPPVAHRDQLGRAAGRLSNEQLDGVPPIGRRSPACERARREAVARVPVAVWVPVAGVCRAVTARSSVGVLGTPSARS